MESGAALVLVTRSRRRERALTEAEVYLRCYGNRALCAVRVAPGSTLQTAYPRPAAAPTR